MNNYQISCIRADDFFTKPSLADFYAPVALSSPYVQSVTVIKRRITNPQAGFGVQLFNTPIYFGGNVGNKVEETVEYTIRKY